MNDSYMIKDYRNKKPVVVKSHTRTIPPISFKKTTRKGKSGFVVSFNIFVRKATIAFLLAVIVASSYVSTFYVGALSVPTIAYASESKAVEQPKIVPPVMKRIAKAESLGSHYCDDTAIRAGFCEKSEKGQTLVKVNKDDTLDVGRYQINTYYWGNEASELGYDIYDEKENELMALWIYENYGTEPWYSSGKNW